MAKKITISVPDELHQKIQENKDGFKVSKVCQRALEEVVNLATLCDERDIEALKKRLEQERKEIFKGYWDEGINDGTSDAFKFNYMDFHKCIDYFKEDNGDCQLKWAAFEYFSSEAYREKYGSIEAGELFIPLNGENNDDRFYADATDMYFTGWCLGVQTVFDQVYGQKK